MDFTEGLGLGTVKLFIVADAGNFGGGMLSCFGGCGAYSESRSLAAWEILRLFFEAFLFQLRLSFRRNEDVEDGVVGSSGLEISVGVSIFCGFPNFCARGPVSRAGRLSSEVSIVVKSPLVLDLGI